MRNLRNVILCGTNVAVQARPRQNRAAVVQALTMHPSLVRHPGMHAAYPATRGMRLERARNGTDQAVLRAGRSASCVSILAGCLATSASGAIQSRWSWAKGKPSFPTFICQAFSSPPVVTGGHSGQCGWTSGSDRAIAGWSISRPAWDGPISMHRGLHSRESPPLLPSWARPCWATLRFLLQPRVRTMSRRRLTPLAPCQPLVLSRPPRGRTAGVVLLNPWTVAGRITVECRAGKGSNSRPALLEQSGSG